jgi:hypothetical protein
VSVGPVVGLGVGLAVGVSVGVRANRDVDATEHVSAKIIKRVRIFGNKRNVPPRLLQKILRPLKKKVVEWRI